MITTNLNHRANLRFACSIVLLLMTAMLVQSAMATDWYVRTDGGNTEQCTGTSNAAYPGSGLNQACALAHPFYLLPPSGNALMVGGDRLQIGPGQYRMGLGAPGSDSCNPSAPWNCTMASIPAGTSANPTRISGQLSGGVCRNAPQLWGVERARSIVTVQDTSNVELSCLEITDHSNCIDGGSARACQSSSAPYGDWAQAGLRLEDASNVKISDVNIHGLANTGVRGGRLSDVSFTRTKVNGNAWSGMDWDLGSTTSSNSGTILFDNVEIGYNGCAEGYPDVSDNFCWAQIEGGYGDGFGSSFTGGKFIIRDSYVHHNTSDGFDFLYADSSAELEVIRSRFVANAGNQLKSSGTTRIDSSEFIGECAFFENVDIMRSDDNCRARGNALSLNFYRGATIELTNSTITSEGDCLIVSGCRDSSCNGTETMNVRNNVFVGQVDWAQPSQKSCLLYDTSESDFEASYDTNVIFNVKDDVCPGGTNICAAPGVRNNSISNFDGELAAGSPAINAANQSFSTQVDVRGRTRPAGSADIGAYEFGAGNSQPKASFLVTSLDVTEGQSSLSITVRLSEAASGDTSVWIATAAGSAIAGADFYGFGFKIDFAAGQTVRQIPFQVIDDFATEASESFNVRLFRPVGLGLGNANLTVNILDNDDDNQAPAVSVSAASYPEDVGVAQISLQLSRAASTETSVAIASRPGTARNGTDFYGFYKIVTFEAGETAANVDLTVVNDSQSEAQEAFSTNLFNADGLVIPQPQTEIIILDDD